MTNLTASLDLISFRNVPYTLSGSLFQLNRFSGQGHTDICFVAATFPGVLLPTTSGNDQVWSGKNQGSEVSRIGTNLPTVV